MQVIPSMSAQGLGNLVCFMSTAFALAVALGRAFVVDFSSFPHEFHTFLRRPQFEWDLQKARQRLGQSDLPAARTVPGSWDEIIDDTVPVIVLDSVPMFSFAAFMREPAFELFLPLFPTRQVFHAQVGQLLDF